MTRIRKLPKAAFVVATLVVLLTVSALADAEVVQHGDLRVSFDGQLTPRALPRHGTAPVQVSVATKITSTNDQSPPQLRSITIAINRFGHFDSSGIPVCTEREIQPSTTQNALAACGSSLVGTGQFSAEILFKQQQAPFPSSGKLYAFNGTYKGKPAILAHVYGTDPVPTSFTFPFVLEQTKGTYGTVLKASFPEVTGNAGYITGISLDLGKEFKAHGKTSSYLSASCPAPKGFPGATFPFAKATLAFAGGGISSVLTRNCKALGE